MLWCPCTLNILWVQYPITILPTRGVCLHGYSFWIKVKKKVNPCCINCQVFKFSRKRNTQTGENKVVNSRNGFIVHRYKAKMDSSGEWLGGHWTDFTSQQNWNVCMYIEVAFMKMILCFLICRDWGFSVIFLNRSC